MKIEEKFEEGRIVGRTKGEKGKHTENKCGQSTQ